MEKPKITKAKMTYIEWVDSASHPYWQGEDTEYNVLKCCSVGWNVKETKEFIALAESISLDDSAKPWADVIVIPKVAITRREILGVDNIRQTHRAKSGTKLFPVRDKKGRFEDLKAYKRAHQRDLKRRKK